MSTTQTTHVYKVVGKLSLTVDLTLPPDFSEDDPLVLHFHGGFLLIGAKNTQPPTWLINACHRRKWAYATPSYRLLPEASGLDMLSDSLDVTKWIYDNITKKILIAGSSAGGYLAFATAALPQAPPLLSVLSVAGGLDFTAPRWVTPGHSIRPVSNLAEQLASVDAAMETGDPIDGYLFPPDPATDKRIQWIPAIYKGAKFPHILTRIPGLAEQIDSQGVDVIPDSQRALFPLSFAITSKFPPTVFLHGDMDDIVEFEQSARAADRLKQEGVEVLLGRVEGLGHGFELQQAVDVDADGSDQPSFYPQFRQAIQFLERIVASTSESA
ncbi:uncharacterized protein N7459_004576 [Penicillium hispanicum]|uniref:uncharacterized protein n=1 Tax=Penicillium hispanicum TaxID=1080232 RepID=UPI00254035BB|nr:uncharacterized protein N7459_004576 [Penicillium hispanicum]KAJ5584776.1 hypothetical protein N7459_004576 [Penicillium hispanicum]